MSFIIILVTSILVFALFRVITLLLCSLVLKLFKLPDGNTGFSLLLSIAFFLVYLQYIITFHYLLQNRIISTVSKNINYFRC